MPCGFLAGLTKSDAVSATGLCQVLGQRTRGRTEHYGRYGGGVERQRSPVGNTGCRDGNRERARIGTLRERPLHASLKRWYAEPGDRTEVAVDGYVIDLVRGDLLIEVQTRGLSSARHKVAALLARGHRLRVIYPIAVDTWIVKFDDDGGVLSRRRSPRHGIPSDVFAELVSVATLLGDPHLEIDLVLIDMEELRFHAPDGPWRRKGWTVEERRLVEILGTLQLRGVADLAALLPPGLPERFTTADLASRLGRPRRAAQQMAYCLRLADVIVLVGKRRHDLEYCLR